MPDILLIQPPIRDFYLTAKRTMPYGLACIAGALRKEGFSVAIFDSLATDKARIIEWPGEMAFLKPFYGREDRSPFALFHHFRHFGYSFEHIGHIARHSGARLIGISSLFSAYSHTALETAAAVRKFCPDATIVMGGHHPSVLPEAVMRHPAVDFVLRGDGEATLPPLARALRDGGDLETVAGLVRRGPKGALIASPPAVVDDLNGLPLPAFDLLDWRFYRRSGKGSLALSAGRGCPMRCTYCAVNASTYHGFRARSVDAVMAEIKAADRIAPLGFIDFEDEHLTADRSWFMALLGAIGDYFKGRLPELRAMNGMFVPTLDREMLLEMRRVGFKALNFALITTDKGQLRRFGRPDLSADLDRVLSAAGRERLHSVAYLIVGGPDQDPFASLADLLFLARRPVLAGVSVFYPAPGSADYQWCRQRGKLPDRPGLWRASTLPLEHATDRRQTVTLLRLGRILNYMKHRLDMGHGLPAPAAPPAEITPDIDRDSAGRMLLSAFLKDGVIRGIDKDGRLYAHEVDAALCRAFIDGVAGMCLRGACPDADQFGCE
ncbi:B12-binding domain-containing radical SAM protein [Desulfatitalea tepidiphila]|uniref:B12-binding domain-containing radical SAM protein n=1 Tax=Desulfatitalea tepidiphila TaxID=1185843 RepID=UPI0006B65EA1|nr:radical SAM protein [Desulfatitalea tepidiphila]